MTGAYSTKGVIAGTITATDIAQHAKRSPGGGRGFCEISAGVGPGGVLPNENNPSWGEEFQRTQKEARRMPALAPSYAVWQFSSTGSKIERVMRSRNP